MHKKEKAISDSFSGWSQGRFSICNAGIKSDHAKYGISRKRLKEKEGITIRVFLGEKT